MEKKYAYITEAGILHVVTSKEGAKKESKNGKYVETSVECENGYPIIVYNNKRETVAVFSLDHAVIDNGSKKTIDGKKINLELYPEIYNLYKSCM